ncbi:hypothetical protein BGZ60DRAFT_31349 [Tricladium varicosporioides]|nr:hypothetical protein BGZ60DRAFT_31349 [Hymenoscyphus varicosporioides]
MSAFPPTRSIPSIPLPQDTALKYLSSYLQSLPNNPHFLPNARLTSTGPTEGTSSSITIHNLQRVEAGLRGEFLKPELEFEEEAVGVAEGMDDGTNKEADGEGWQDLGEYQREQSIEGGVMQEGDSEWEGRRSMNGEEGDMDDNEDAEALKAKVKKTHKKALAPTPVDKEARKREKKAREKELKRQKALAARKVAEES